MSAVAIAIFSLVLIVAMVKIWSLRQRSRRADFIRTYSFPAGVLDRFESAHPALSPKDRHLVARGLRQFFLAYLGSGRKPVSMPSRVVDDLWHAFILHTRHYQAFCTKAFGRFMHHTPAVVLGANRHSNAGLRRTWWYACLEAKIDPKKPDRLPLLFALDEQLKIEDGFRYRLDCSGLRRDPDGSRIHSSGDLSSRYFDGTTDGLGGSSFGQWGDWTDWADWGGGDGDGGGCGGD